MLERELEERLPTPMKFWGRLSGVESDYLVAFTLLPEFGFPAKKFYYCNTSDFRLRQLPQLSEEFSAKAAECKGLFSGDPSLLSAGDEEPESPGVDEEGNELPAPEVFREVHRLAFTVAAIDEQAHAIPRGAFVATGSHQVVENGTFEGLSSSVATDLSSYFHFRAPKGESQQAALARPGLVRPSDFLDPLTSDGFGAESDSRGSSPLWSLSMHPSQSHALLRSLLWPGAVAFQQVGGKAWGWAYFGNGLVNEDIAFMV
jgi:radial spoke head protein 9